MIISRDLYMNQLIKLRDNKRVKIITGLRRCGKSFLLQNLFISYLLYDGVDKNHIIYIALDDADNIDLLNPIFLYNHIKSLIKDNMNYYVIIDEIQLVYTIINPILTNGEIKIGNPNDEGTISFVDIILGLLHKDNIDVYISGSNSKLLSKDILTKFRDRGDEIRVRPLSFSEFYSSKNFESKEIAFKEYILYGGMPGLINLNIDIDKGKYLNNLFELTYHKDVIERNNIRNEESIKVLTKILASSVGSLINSKNISNTFKSSNNENISSITISSYLSYLEDSFIITKVDRYDIKGKKHIGATNKYYFEDVGLRNSRLNFLHVDYGYLMENIIFNELKNRGFDVEIGYVEKYTKNENNVTIRKIYESDFIARKGSYLCYIQSCYKLDSKEKENQEINSLININDSFKKIVITYNNGPIRRDENGIIFIDLFDFLLDLDIISKI